MATDDLDKVDLDLIADEETRYRATFSRIQRALRDKTAELSHDEKLARELTAELVATKRDEEKQFLQSDESVAHGLAHLRFQQAGALSDLSKQPYFARVIYHEKNRDVEFKLGVAGFSEERIIDWRKAPISKLYYDYEEGDEYDDEIAGVERQGRIKLKRAYRGEFDELANIELKDASYVKSHGRWNKYRKQSQTVFSVKDKEKVRELIKSHAPLSVEQLSASEGYLSQILSLLSPEQFRLISSDLIKPVIIQGSAGTGKTTVALHRLAWLLFEENSPAKEERSLVVMFNPTLAHYVEKVLPSLGVHKVKIVTYADWARDIIRSSAPISYRFRDWDVPQEVSRFKSAEATFERLLNIAAASGSASPQEILESFYRSLSGDAQLSHKIQEYVRGQLNKKFFDSFDLAPLLHLIFERDGCYTSRSYPVALDHLVIDEAQDFTIPEIKTLLAALPDKKQLTIAGDLGQKILENRDFGSWEELLQKLGLKGVDVLNLSVAYRSTYQIYEIAEFIRDPSLADEDLKMVPRFGPEPLLTVCHNRSEAIDMTRAWIEDVITINQKVVGAVICRTPQEARQVFDALIRLGVHGIRHGDAQHFEFTPGITITDVRQVKGLEFQCLLVFNPSEKSYPAVSAQDRNLLYVAVTRAVFKIDFVSFEPLTAILPEFINTRDLTAVVEEEADDNRFLFEDEAAERERATCGEELVPDEGKAKRESDDEDDNEAADEESDMTHELQTGEGVETDDFEPMEDDLNVFDPEEEDENS